jgi:L-fucose mutarotase/ribose pyranase (RbsD/FucU family)
MTSDVTPSTQPDWELHLNALLPLFGHRNWILVADSAYPAQSRPGIETIVAEAEHIHVLKTVMDAITASRHVRANVYLDSELGFVEEIDAPGIAEYRQQLDTVLYGFHVNPIPHEQVIHKVDQSAQVFRILIIKTEMTIPYTSVFIELDCDYWNAEAEERLRQAIHVADSQ